MIALMIHSAGQPVQVLQLALFRAGLYSGELDGLFGDKTLESVRLFQSISGLKVTGVVARLTWQKLMPYLTGYRKITISPGDTLWGLARQYGSSISAISMANPNLDPMQISTLTEIIIPLPFPVVATNIGYSWELLSYTVDGLIKRYPHLTLETIGKSVMGHSIYSLSIGQGNRKILANSSHHANEWITTPLLLKFIEEYAQSIASGLGIGGISSSKLMQDNTFFAIPMVNPDGVDLVNGVISDGPYYRTAIAYSADYRNIPFPSGWKANIRGVDLNLQYPAEWDLAKEIKFTQGYKSPGPRDYVGPKALSEPESVAMYKYTLDKGIDISVSFHTQGQVIYWKYLDKEPKGSRILAEKMSMASGYTLEDTPFISGHAGYKDWFISAFDRPGFTPEMGIGESPLPLSQFGQIYQAGKSILLETMR